MADGRQPTLQRRLLGQLLWPLLVLLLISVMIDYHVASSSTADVYDHDLLDDAGVLAAKVQADVQLARIDLSEAATLFKDSDDNEMIAVWGSRGELLVGDALLGPALPKPGQSNPYLDDDVISGQPVRKAVFRMNTANGPVTLVVAETTRQRLRAATGILLSLIAPNLVLIFAALGLVYFGVNRASKSLTAVSQTIAERSPSDLGPLSSQGVPAEIDPVIKAMNHFMERLRISAQSQQALFADAAHQLKTPLAGLQTQLELAIAESTDKERSRIRLLLGVSQRIAHLTHQLLALARSGPDVDLVGEKSDVDIVKLIEDSASDWYSRGLLRAMEVAFDLSPCRTWGSIWLLREMLENLVDNAIKYGPLGGTVWVRCGEGPDRCPVVEVQDSGPGIPLAEQENVFQRFYRAPGTPGEGTGLGLAIVKEIAERHGASVSLVCTEGEAGFCVRVRFQPQNASRA